MALQSHAALAEIRDTLLETYASNDAMNQLILSHLDPRAWRPAAGSKRQWPQNRGHLRASAQQPSFVAEAFRAASEVSAATRSPQLHHEAGCCRAQEKRRAVPAHVVGCSLGRSESPRFQVLSRQLGANVARRRDHVRLHVLARGTPSRPNFDAGPPARLPCPQSHVRHLAMGEALETNRPYHAPALSGTRPPRSS